MKQFAILVSIFAMANTVSACAFTSNPETQSASTQPVLDESEADRDHQERCVARPRQLDTCGSQLTEVYCEGQRYCTNRPSMISGPMPYLPPEAIAHRVLGTVIARCTITERGSVEACKIMQSLPYADAAFIETSEAQTYTPVLVDNKPVRVRYTFKVVYK